VARVGKDVPCWSDFHNRAKIEDRDAIANRLAKLTDIIEEYEYTPQVCENAKPGWAEDSQQL
jgi:hypothetical protein